ncbi:MAG: peptidoglycan DD-metalloendopeptidase family protein [Clostridia bacterium]|nr:peptidoglycan DD-metalloendopeptidase family protein [Clostridia bacterium]
MKKWRSVIAMTIIVLLVLGMLTSIVLSVKTYGATDSVSDMQNELNDLAEKREKLEKELNKIKNQKEATLEQKEIIDRQIIDLNDEAEILENMVDKLSDQLKESEEKLDRAEADLDENTQLAKDRIRAMYELGNTSYVEIILSSTSLHDFVGRVELVKQMASYDKSVIDNLKKTKETIETETKSIKEKTEKQQAALSTMESNLHTLEKKQSQSDALIQKFNEQTEENKRALAAAEAAEEKLQEEIRAALAGKGDEEFVGGEWLWPVNGYYGITSKFGYRYHPLTGVYKMHTGVDVAGSGINRKPIRAANSGTVLKAGYNVGYGNYVVIDHGGGYTTLYGHASSLAVSAGQKVSRGDTIAYVGSTGYSTGPHLHYEIIQNGERKNPLSFYSHINFIYY